MSVVADELGVNERPFRRVFRTETGVSPKTIAKPTRFRQAVSAAQATQSPSWASVAAEAGYYGQAHPIAEFHTIAGTTPRSLLAEFHRQHA